MVVLEQIAITMHILRNFRRKSFGEIENLKLKRSSIDREIKEFLLKS